MFRGRRGLTARPRCRKSRSRHAGRLRRRGPVSRPSSVACQVSDRLELVLRVVVAADMLPPGAVHGRDGIEDSQHSVNY